MIDPYCERYGPELLAEPINAFTNLAFLVAAWAVWRLARHHKSLNAETWALITFSVMIGIGSTLFHTFATNWSQILDIVSILLFQLIFIWLYLRRIVGIHSGIVTVATASFLAIVLFASGFSEMLNGSLLYVPAILVLLGFSIYHFRQCRYERGALFTATGVFILALIFRSIDTAVCPGFPIGTHFLWHILVAVVLYLSTRALILNQVSSKQGLRVKS
jgi:hypothetical protein